MTARRPLVEEEDACRSEWVLQLRTLCHLPSSHRTVQPSQREDAVCKFRWEGPGQKMFPHPQAFSDLCPWYWIFYSVLPDDLPGRAILSQTLGRLSLHHSDRGIRHRRVSECITAEEAGHFTLDSFQSVGLMEKIQAIAQNVSDIAVKVDQILRNSLMRGKVMEGQRDMCEIPRDPRYPDCSAKVEWMRSRWTSDPCYAFYGVDGTECSFLVYLSEVEWFCPVLPWRNQSINHFSKPVPKKQAAFRTELSSLLDLMGTGKESLIFMKKRLRRLEVQWLLGARRLESKLENTSKEQKQILVHIGFLTEESGDVFSPRVLKGGPLGEMVQWADILAALYMLGHSLKITVSVKELQSYLGVPPGRGNCPLTEPLPFDLIYTDYHGMQQMKQHMGLSFRKYRCRLRVVDTFGTEPAYNHEEYATLHGYRTNWGYWNLNPKQFMTMFPHTPDNSFMGFVTDELNETERQQVALSKVRNMAVVYGKEAAMWKLLQSKEKFLAVLHKHMEIHGTVYFETQRPPEVPAFVKNHGLLPQQDLQQLLKKAKLFIGFGFPYEGPAPLEAVANGCVFLQPRFNPPHSSLNHEFFRGKPTSREVSSQHPYMEMAIGKPHVLTVDFNNTQEFEAAIKAIMRNKVEPYLPYEYTSEGMLQRLHTYIQHQSPPCRFGFLPKGNPAALHARNMTWCVSPVSSASSTSNRSWSDWELNVTALNQ
ncbi:alpha-1,6-mannosylglyco 6-beta-N-acetylglucosaminyltransferase B isoform X2 [Pelobates cultripes]|uniref:alpha-1,6-mannosyl-glycoprotein 6-beta-N-acetylglucosaminyltransferase n=1 Tax=Pelobates cultripes TaxID=61616 RepID=A0AAD1SJ33_PELCU|nr:alpha-1,6-mannosylglyco 6-beta-N-acetylglucosaminyltransferase B isoform X2 [Pelobates cultripes]